MSFALDSIFAPLYFFLQLRLHTSHVRILVSSLEELLWFLLSITKLLVHHEDSALKMQIT